MELTLELKILWVRAVGLSELLRVDLDILIQTLSSLHANILLSLETVVG